MVPNLNLGGKSGTRRAEEIEATNKRGGIRMAAQEKILFEKKFIGNPVEIGTSKERYQDFLMESEEVRMEFKGFRDALIFTDLRYGCY